ncbi:HAD family hydrolase [Yinghuangia sp. YIM S09857]|uniref:HAD family hydrolase n=1 Tax=Yinghuangia sp. YIM S09857 TaxID=3436929 RepID=UPI003F53AF15
MADGQAGNSAGPVLVLWDIDQTLVKAGPASREAYADALLAVTGRPLTERVDFGGRTDLHIARETLRAHGLLPTDDLITRLNETFAEIFTARAEQVRGEGVALPGAVAAIEVLAELPYVVQSVLTGNQAATAPVKLSLLGDAARHLCLGVGAYGDDHEDRDKLVPIAIGRAVEVLGGGFTAARTVLIGDTVRDVEAAAHNDAMCVAVATGYTTAEELARAGADIVLRDLTDVAVVVEAVRSLGSAESAA